MIETHPLESMAEEFDVMIEELPKLGGEKYFAESFHDSSER
jgi:hypothetical protein